MLSVTCKGALVVSGNVSGKLTDGLLELIFGTVPVPESVSECGLPAALSVMLSVAERVPSADGLKVTVTAVLLPAAILIGNEDGLKVKSAAFVPVMDAFEITSVWLPVLLTVAVAVTEVFAGWLPNDRLAGDMLNDGPPLGPGALTLVPQHAI